MKSNDLVDLNIINYKNELKNELQRLNKSLQYINKIFLDIQRRGETPSPELISSRKKIRSDFYNVQNIYLVVK